jgi:hypothetical protein
MSQRSDKRNMANTLSFIFDAPLNEDIVKMDCNDYCEELAELAEQVANGAKLEDLLPDLEEHMQYWSDCREEFDALVAVLKAEKAEKLLDALEQAQQDQAETPAQCSAENSEES